MKEAFTLKGVNDREFEDSLETFERELAVVFRGIESAMYKEVRRAMEGGLSLEEAIKKAVDVLDKEVPDAYAKTEEE